MQSWKLLGKMDAVSSFNRVQWRNCQGAWPSIQGPIGQVRVVGPASWAQEGVTDRQLVGVQVSWEGQLTLYLPQVCGFKEYIHTRKICTMQKGSCA